MYHKMKLLNEPFCKILSGEKTIELRLLDEKRQKVKIGDKIEFTNMQTKKRMVCDVLNIYNAKSFKELFEKIDINKAGFNEKDIDSAEEKMASVYSEEREKKFGAVGIEISSPKCEIEFPLDISDDDVKTALILPLYNDKLVTFTDENGVENFPFVCDIKENKNVFKSAENTVLARMGECEISSFYELTSFCENGKGGRVYIAMLETVPDNTNCKAVLLDIAPENDINMDFPPLPEMKEHKELYAVVLHTLQRMFFNSDVCYFEKNSDALEYEYTKRLKCYDDEIYFDYENFDADEFARFIMTRSDIDIFDERINRVPKTEVNFDSIRNVLCDGTFVTGYVMWIIKNYGKDVILEDEELMESLYESHSTGFINTLLGIENSF